MSTLISSPVVNVDVSAGSKTVQLPPANTVLGKTFLIRDATGACGTSGFIDVIPTGGDTVDYIPSTPIQLTTPYESICLIAESSTNYSILSRSINSAWSPSV